MTHQIPVHYEISDIIRGYDDAVASHAELIEIATSWSTLWHRDFRDIGRKSQEELSRFGKISEQTRSAIVRIQNLMELSDQDIKTIDKKSVLQLSQMLNKRVIGYLREASLVYVSDKTVRNMPSGTVSDRHEIPFPGPFLLYPGPKISPWSIDVPQDIRRDVQVDDQVNQINDELKKNGKFVDLVGYLVIPYDWGFMYMSFVDVRRWDKVNIRVMPDVFGSSTYGNIPEEEEAKAVVGMILSMGHRNRRIAVVTGEQVSKPTRRAAKRANLPNPGSLNVIYMPTERELLGKGGSHTSPRRHMVRAHWRKQPYGPKGSNKWRWTLVEEHERGKGPLIATHNVWRE